MLSQAILSQCESAWRLKTFLGGWGAQCAAPVSQLDFVFAALLSFENQLQILNSSSTIETLKQDVKYVQS